MGIRLHFLGAAGCVTGACFRLEMDDADILIDCGLFQGSKTLKELNYQKFPFDPRRIDALLLTHAHIDHAGQIPKLVLAGFGGPVFATAPTRDLCAVVLPDAGGIQEHEVEQLNRRMQRRGRAAIAPIYTREDAEDSLRTFEIVRLNQWVDAAKGIRARWWNAGHILGSASIEVEVTRSEKPPLRLLFSGDVGPKDRDFAADPDGPVDLDYLVVEATYGATQRLVIDSAGRRRILVEAVSAAHQAGGPLLIPAFAVERTQELLADLLSAMADGAIPEGQIYLDSPLAIRATEVFLEQGRGPNGGNPFAGLRRAKMLHTTESADESRALERLKGWHIIIAGSGMCDAGRIRHHLKRLLWRREVSVLLPGFQAIGTLGRILQDGARSVKIQGEDIRVNAQIRTLDIYSGHADADGLMAWVAARGRITGSIFLTHGEPGSLKGFAARLIEAGCERSRVITPEIDEVFTLKPGALEKAAPAQPARIAAGAAGGLDWHNARAALLLELDEVLRGAPDDRTRQGIMEKMRALIERVKG